MAAKNWRLVISCEHASHAVPAAYRTLFSAADDVLTSHHGWDTGAAHFAKALGRAFGLQPHCGQWSRLLIDINRSPGHPRHFSEYSRTLDKTARQKLHNDVYQPFRKAVSDEITGANAAGTSVLHVAVHSFTPVFKGHTRNADIGLLYDPSRPNELAFATKWQALLATTTPTLRVRRNYPYRGIDDGHCTALRRQFTDAHYAGIELEINQAILANNQLPAAATASLQQSVLALL